MRDLLYKDFKLFWASPVFFLCLIFGVFLLIPHWLYFIAFGYIIWIGFVSVFFIGRSNHDTFFSVSLPVRKKDTVVARVCTIAVIELLQILVAIPFAVINSVIYQSNEIGMNPNFAFFGTIFIMYGIFNIIFLPWFYKTAYNVGKPLLIGIIASTVFVIVANFAVMLVPVLKTNLNGQGATNFGCQLPVLLAGIVLFVLLTWLAYKISANNFEKVDL